jgi:hypothetical protein
MLVQDLQLLCIYYLDILNYEKQDIIMSFANNKKIYNIYDIWYKNSKHEIIEHDDDGKGWYVNGKLHRNNDLPAIEYDGIKMDYYIEKMINLQ